MISYILKGHPIKFQVLKIYLFAMALFSLLVAWGLEKLARELFRLAII